MQFLRMTDGELIPEGQILSIGKRVETETAPGGAVHRVYTTLSVAMVAPDSPIRSLVATAREVSRFLKACERPAPIVVEVRQPTARADDFTAIRETA